MSIKVDKLVKALRAKTTKGKLNYLIDSLALPWWQDELLHLVVERENWPYKFIKYRLPWLIKRASRRRS